jgi:hypothetical protein
MARQIHNRHFRLALYKEASNIDIVIGNTSLLASVSIDGGLALADFEGKRLEGFIVSDYLHRI